MTRRMTILATSACIAVIAGLLALVAAPAVTGQFAPWSSNSGTTGGTPMLPATGAAAYED